MRTVIAALALILALPAPAALRLSLAAPPDVLVAGQAARFDVVGRALDTAEAFPASLALRIEAGETTSVVTLRLEGAVAAVAAGGVGVATYRGAVPEGIRGDAVFALEADPGVRLAVPVAAALAADGLPGVVERPAPAYAPFNWLRPFYSHEPLYFAIALHEEVDARFQISFKYRITGGQQEEDKAAADGWLAPSALYFGYTQTSLWDILESSSPFRDTSYRPSLFWQERDVVDTTFDGGTRFRLTLQGGFEHESNGRAEPQSRSMNVLFVRPFAGWITPSGWRFLVSPRFNAFVEKTDNQELDQYRGYVDLLLSARAPHADGRSDGGWQLALLGRKGTRGAYGSVQADLTHPNLFGLPGYIQFQAFHGWGETLLQYDERTDLQFRIGFAAIR
jgi:outer membrane phospholipase A